MVISILSLGEGWSRFASNAAHSLLSRAAGSLSEGGVLIKEERQHKLSCTCVGWPWIFLAVVTLDASTGGFVVSIMVRSDDTKTHLQPPLMLETHSLP